MKRTTLKSITTAISRKKPITPTSTPKPRRKSDRNPSVDKKDGHNKRKEETTSNNALKRTLGVRDLIFYGIGCSVGAGIYSLVGIGAKVAGPAISLSFALCGLACCFTSLAYAEFAARVPLAGSAYTFAYVTFGELAGWLVGWNLTLGYAVSAAAVSRSWAVYVSGFFHGWLQGLISGSEKDSSWQWIARTADNTLQWFVTAPFPVFRSESDDSDGYECCPLAAIVILLCTSVLITGAKESSRFNTIMTILNLSVLGFVVLVGWTTGSVRIHDNLFTPTFFPEGYDGVGRAAGLVFFSYLGFDMVSCLSEEVKNPERNLPIGIVGSLVSSTIVYCIVSITVVGMAPIKLLGEDVPVVNALLANACCTHDEQLRDIAIHATSDFECLSYASCERSSFAFPLLFYGSRLISFAAIFGLTTATFACLMGQPRIFFSMAQDGLLFDIYGRVDPDTGVPTMGTIITGITTALVACFVDLESLANTISLGTLQVFTFVNAGVIVLRMTPPLLPVSMMEDQNNCESLDNEEAAVQRGHAVDEKSKLISNGREEINYESTRCSSFGSSATSGPRSILLPDDGGAVLVRGASREFNSSIRSASSLFQGNNPNNLLPAEELVLLLEKNGSKPHWLAFVFTISSVLCSVGVSCSWSMWIQLVLVSIMIYSVVWLWLLPQADPPQTFSSPCVPGFPLLGIFFNSYMMGSMSLSTWSVIATWLFLGVCFYFSYGIHHSELRKGVNSS